MGYDEERLSGAPTGGFTSTPLSEKYGAAATTDVDSRGSSGERGYDTSPTMKETGVFAGLRRFEATMDRKLGVESQAIERKLPEDRRPVSFYEQLSMSLLWYDSYIFN